MHHILVTNWAAHPGAAPQHIVLPSWSDCTMCSTVFDCRLIHCTLVTMPCLPDLILMGQEGDVLLSKALLAAWQASVLPISVLQCLLAGIRWWLLPAQRVGDGNAQTPAHAPGRVVACVSITSCLGSLTGRKWLCSCEVPGWQLVAFDSRQGALTQR